MAKISVALILVLFATLFTFSEATPLQQPETKGVCLVYFRFKIFNIFHISALQFWLVQSTWTILLQWWLLQYRTKLLYFLWLQKMYISKLWWLLQDCTWIKWVIEKHNIFQNFKCTYFPTYCKLLQRLHLILDLYWYWQQECFAPKENLLHSSTDKFSHLSVNFSKILSQSLHKLI